MSIVSALAIYFIIWWITLFALLPVGLRTQDEDNDVTLGTVASAPARSHVRRAFLRTTIVATVIFAAYYYVTQHSGLSFDDIPRIVPELK